MKRSRLAAVAAEVVAATTGSLPADLRKTAHAAAVRIEASPGPEVLGEGFEPDILGLFAGEPLGGDAGTDALPPQIFLYTDNLWDYAGGDLQAFREEVRITFLHELGHLFGWDEDDLASRGLG